MSRELKKDWLPKLQERYARRHREGKSRMMDKLCEDYGYERKYAIKLLSGVLPLGPGRAPPGPERRYEGIEQVVRQIWLTSEHESVRLGCGHRGRAYGRGGRVRYAWRLATTRTGVRKAVAAARRPPIDGARSSQPVKENSRSSRAGRIYPWILLTRL